MSIWRSYGVCLKLEYQPQSREGKHLSFVGGAPNSETHPPISEDLRLQNDQFVCFFVPGKTNGHNWAMWSWKYLWRKKRMSWEIKAKFGVFSNWVDNIMIYRYTCVYTHMVLYRYNIFSCSIDFIIWISQHLDLAAPTQDGSTTTSSPIGAMATSQRAKNGPTLRSAVWWEGVASLKPT